MAKNAPTKQSTQKYLDIAEIKEDTVVLKDGTLRSVLLVSSINFSLKSDLEQQALITGYTDLINSYEYPVQVVIQSRKLNMEKYLTKLVMLEKEQKNDLLKVQMNSYRNFVKELVEIGEIMTKRFYMVIPYSPFTAKRKNFFIKLREVFTPGSSIKLSQKRFDGYRHDLETRTNQIIGSLTSLGLNAVLLDTQSLIELYYNAYNPQAEQTQELEDINKVQVETEFK